MRKAGAAEKEPEVFVQEVVKGRMTFCILGTSPFICNRMSQKGMRELLMPKGKKNAAERASSLKHDPLAEFRDSPYTARANNGATRIHALGSMFKGSMREAGGRLPGTNRTQIGQLVHVEQDRIELFGEPQLFMSVTRSADINRTPDVRTRAIIPAWACKVTVTFVKPIMREQSVANLMSAAGYLSGVGDFRPEKGKGNYGCFRLVEEGDADFRALLKHGREVQDKALASPRCYDDETESLLAWFTQEVGRRGFKAAEAEAPAEVEVPVPVARRNQRRSSSRAVAQ